jgi:polyvinyl alcohol dehydrogenase (cytochrome)
MPELLSPPRPPASPDASTSRLRLPAHRGRAVIAVAGAMALAAGGILVGGRPGGASASLPCSGGGLSGGTWPMYGHDPSNTRRQPAEKHLDAARARRLAPAWTFSIASQGDTGQFNSTPIVADGCAFVTASNGGVYAVNASTGAFVWKHVFAVTSAGLGGAIVGGAALDGGHVIVIVNETGDGTALGPYVAALDEQTGSEVWQSAPLSHLSGYYSNGTPQVIGGVVFAGFSPAEGDSSGQGGFALLDAASGALVKETPTISPADQAQGFAGGGIWSTPAWDPETGFAYVGAGNPYSKDREDVHTNAILKIDMRPGSRSFGSIVASYKGNVDQYTQALQALSHTPLCAASAGAPDPLDDPACGQLDLDFGASPNLFRSGGREVVGDLQKAGVYHVADAHSMAPVWSTVVGATCQACNAASAAVDGDSVIDASAPGSVMFALHRDGGAVRWALPIGDGTHYQATSVADGVAYTFDGLGFLDVVDAATGIPIMRRPMTLDTQTPMGALVSGGIAIAYHTVYVAASGGPGNGLPASAVLIAYRSGG